MSPARACCLRERLGAAAAAEARAKLTSVHEIDLESFDSLPLADRYFDCITFADVLEHLRDPYRALVLLRRHLADGGFIVCSIPNIRHESVLVPLLVEGKFTYVDEGILDRTHLRFFTAREIGFLLDVAGFTLSGGLHANRTPATSNLEALAELVRRLGGDDRRFREEATIVQYIFRARPKGG